MNIKSILFTFAIGLVCFIQTEVAFGQTDENSFFHLEESDDGTWQLLDPAGKIFYLRGLNHYGDGSHMPWNLKERFGDAAGWRNSLPERLEEWGFNYLPPSIGPSAIDPSTLPPEQRLLRHKRVTRTPEWTAEQFDELNFPFTLFLEVPRQHMGGTSYPDVFSEEFREAVDARCREICLPLRDSRNLIGYHYTQNPPWHPRAKGFDTWIDDTVKPGSAGLDAWIGLMKRIYGSTERWRRTYGYPIKDWSDIANLESPLRGFVSQDDHLRDREAFMRLICREWYRVYHDAIRKYDSNHLILGDRNTLHLQPVPPFAINEMKPYVDVLSVNVMGPPDTVYHVLELVTPHWDDPLLLADTGSGIFESDPAKSTYTARDLDEFGEVYAGMADMTLEHPQIIGFGWCGFYETPHPGGRSGLVDVKNGEPLPERLELMRKANARLAGAESKESDR